MGLSYKKLEDKYNNINNRLDDIIVMSNKYNWYSDTSMRFTLDKIKKELEQLRNELDI